MGIIQTLPLYLFLLVIPATLAEATSVTGARPARGNGRQVELPTPGR